MARLPYWLPRCGAAAALSGIALAVWVGRRALAPLRDVADRAARDFSEELGARLPDPRGSARASTIESCNRMVGSLQWRIDREYRLFGDVGHEPRTPLNTRTASVDVLDRYEEDLLPRARQALELVTADVHDLLGLLDDLLALARVEAGLDQSDVDQLSVRELLVHTLRGSRRPAELLTVNDDVTMFGRKLELERAVANLLENADQRGDDIVAGTVSPDCDEAAIAVDDAPGVLSDDLERVSGRRTPDTPEDRAGAGSRDRSILSRPGRLRRASRMRLGTTIRLPVVEGEGRHRPVTRP